MMKNTGKSIIEEGINHAYRLVHYLNNLINNYKIQLYF